MFQFGGFPSCTYWFSTGSTVLHRRGFPIRRSSGHSLFPAHRGLSQVVASFFGSWCQGIHLMLFFAWTARLIHSSLRFAYCLSSQIIVLGCELHKKTILFLNSTIFHPLFRVFGKIVFILSDNPYFWKDLLISKLKNLSIQLSVRFFLLYSVFNERLLVRSIRGALVGPSGLEPPTSCLSGTRSNLLSYEPISCSLVFHLLVEMMGFEPMTPCLQGRCSPSWATPP